MTNGDGSPANAGAVERRVRSLLDATRDGQQRGRMERLECAVFNQL